MRTRLIAAVLFALATPALAQVTTDQGALDALPPAAKPATPKAPVPATRKRPARHAAPAPAGKRLPAVPMPAAPPANPVIAPPPLVMPAHPPPPPPTVPVRDDAVGTATIASGGRTRITFGPGSADLNPSTLAAIRAVAARALADPAMVLGVTAWAPGPPDDPSTPRRLSLDRALSVRAVLINAGVVSERIRTVAKGTADLGDGTADRADVQALPAGK